MKDGGVPSPRRQIREAVSQREVASSPEICQGVAKDTRDIQKLLGKGAIYTEADWAKLRASYCPSLWEISLTNDRSKLVQELIEDHSNELLLRKVAKRDLAGLANDEAECLSIWFTASLASACSPADSLPNAFAVRGESPEPTKGDLIMYVLFRDAYLNREGRSCLDLKQKERWREMAGSVNPLVRLLAAETYLHVEESPSDWIVFYSAFKGDSDPYIIEKALSALYTAGNSDAIKVLADFDKSEVVSGSPLLRRKVANMILSLQKNADNEK